MSGRPEWHKGMVSPNPKGGPRGRFAYASRIAEATKDGALMLQVAMKCALNDFAADADRLSACRLLLEYWIGKPRDVLELDVAVRPDFSRLTTEDLEHLKAIARKALPPPEKP